MNSTKRISPWAWVPTLYFAQGIPYFIVNNISVLMFAKMGVPNGEMALFTSLLYLPWTIKPVHRHHQDQTMVDHLYANPDVDSIHPVDTVYSETG